jgi:hypothetical protein
VLDSPVEDFKKKPDDGLRTHRATKKIAPGLSSLLRASHALGNVLYSRYAMQRTLTSFPFKPHSAAIALA